MNATADWQPTPKWFVVQTKPRGEAWACENLEAQGFATLFPRFYARKRLRGIMVEYTFPAFVSYAFVKFDPADEPWGAIKNTRGVSRLLCDHAGKPEALPDDVARLLVARFGDGPLESLDAAMQVIKEGMKLRVKRGPFEGATGACLRSRSGRITMLLSLFGGERKHNFDLDDVEIHVEAAAE